MTMKTSRVVLPIVVLTFGNFGSGVVMSTNVGAGMVCFSGLILLFMIVMNGTMR